MANLKISQLTTYTGTSADLRWFVMNNSGETETFKFSGYTSPFRYVDDTLKNSVYLGNSTNTISSTGVDNIIIGGSNNQIRQTAQKVAIIASDSVDIAFTADKAASIASLSSGFDGGARVAAVGTTSASFNGTDLFIGGSASCFLGSCGQSAIIGSNGSTLWTTNSSVIVGGTSHYLQPYTSSNNVGFFAGNDNEINGTNSSNSTLIGGSNNFLGFASPSSSIISSTGSTISGKTMSVMIGTSGRTASQNFATHVENLVVFNYANLDFADDTAAAAGGVVLGQVYHNAGALRIRVV